jgi:Tol biopolymer transport system component
MKLFKTLSFGIIILTVVMVSSGYSKTYKIETPVFAPDDSIVFSFSCKSNEYIYRIKNDGTNLKRLTELNDRRYFGIAYSPNGTRIAFSSAKKGQKNANLYIMDSNGKNITRLTKDNYSDFEPAFSPDGKSIYFLRARGGHPQLKDRWFDVYSINSDGSDLKAITKIDVWLMSGPSVSPDGKQLLVHYRDSNDSLWLISVDTPKEMVPIRPDNRKDDAFSQPKFSPDGKSILFVWPGRYQKHF